MKTPYIIIRENCHPAGFFLTRFLFSQLILFYSYRRIDHHRWSSSGTVSSHRRGGLQIKSRFGQAACHAIWRLVKILIQMKTTDGGRNVDVSKNVLVVK